MSLRGFTVRLIEIPHYFRLAFYKRKEMGYSAVVDLDSRLTESSAYEFSKSDSDDDESWT